MRTGPPSPTEDRILQAVLRYHYLTSKQLTKLLFTYPSSHNHAREYLQSLTARGYLQRLYLPRASQYGGAPSVFTLSRKGQQHLAQSGADVPTRARPYKQRQHTHLFYAHTLAVTDFLLAAERLTRQHPDFTIARLLHDRDLQRTLARVTITDPETGVRSEVTYIPDGYLDLRHPAPDGTGTDWWCLALELDRGTEGQAKFRRKLRAILAWEDGPYQREFGTRVLTVCIVAVPTPTAPGPKRLAQLLSWTRTELAALGRERDADVFRLTTLDLEEASPEEVFLAPRWYAPTTAQPMPLLEGVK